MEEEQKRMEEKRKGKLPMRKGDAESKRSPKKTVSKNAPAGKFFLYTCKA